MLDDGTQVTDEIAMADAHPQGASPFARANYIAKFDTLAAHAVSETERTRFTELATNVGTGDAASLTRLLPVADTGSLQNAARNTDGIF